MFKSNHVIDIEGKGSDLPPALVRIRNKVSFDGIDWVNEALKPNAFSFALLKPSLPRPAGP